MAGDKGKKRGDEKDPLIPNVGGHSSGRPAPPPPPPPPHKPPPPTLPKAGNSVSSPEVADSKPAIELTKGKGGKAPVRSKKIVMKASDALRMLGLEKYPYRAQIQTAFDALSERYEGNLRKQNELILARNALNTYQGQLLGNFKAAFLKENSLDAELVAWRQKYEKHYPTGVAVVIHKINDFKTLNEKYFFDVSQPTADLRAVDEKYYQDTKTLYDSMENSIEPLELGRALLQSTQCLRVNLNDRLRRDKDGKLKYAPMQGEQITVNPVTAYKEAHADYLQMILDLKADFIDHQQDLDELHDAIRTLGDKYINAVQENNADIEHLSTEYAAGFKAAVYKAHTAFSTSAAPEATTESGTGLWACLYSILKLFSLLLFCFRCHVSEPQERENPHRFHAVGPASIEDRWHQWQLDTMPKFDQDAYQAQSVGKTSG